jgi:hypothetical protein
MFYKDNWMTWYYDGVEKGNKTSPDSKYELKITPTIKQPVKSYKEELLANARLIRDSFNEPFDLLFSGGVDSEVVLRCNHELDIPVNVYVFRYENNYNLSDVTHALRICDELNVTPTVIDFNLKHFFENDAYDVWRTGYFKSSGRLPHLKMIEYLDNIPIFGDSNPHWEYSGGEWLIEFSEKNHSQTIYGTSVGRKMLPDWYEYSPEVIVSNLQVPTMQELLAGGNTNFELFKYQLHNSIWPEIKIRPKLVGFECFDHRGNPITIPDFMMDFQRQCINIHKMKFVSYKFTQDQFIKKLCLF